MKSFDSAVPFVVAVVVVGDWSCLGLALFRSLTRRKDFVVKDWVLDKDVLL